MNNSKMKIYIASENDTVDSICNQFNIDLNTLYIFNPLIRHKIKLTNLPIKIPYQKTIVRQEETINPLAYYQAIYLTYLFKNYIMYQVLSKKVCSYYKNTLFSLNYGGFYKEMITKTLYIIDEYDTIEENEYETILNELHQMLNNDNLYLNMIHIVLNYLNLLKANQNKEGEMSINNYLNKLKGAVKKLKSF